MQASAAGSPGDLAAGMWQALYCRSRPGSGNFCHLGYNLLVTKIDAIVLDMDLRRQLISSPARTQPQSQ